MIGNRLPIVIYYQKGWVFGMEALIILTWLGLSFWAGTPHPQAYCRTIALSKGLPLADCRKTTSPVGFAA